MNVPDPMYPYRKLQPAFLETVIPGLVGGVASALVGYPLELVETTLQASTNNQSPNPGAPVAKPRARKARVKPSSPPTPPSSTPPPIQLAAAHHSSSASAADSLPPQELLFLLYRSNGLAGVFRGADMALASALFGFGAFFGAAAVAEALHPCAASPALELMKNIVAASAAQLVNSPFQLLKTTAIVGACSTREAFDEVTQGGKNIAKLWTGVQANMLGVGLVASQFTVFRLLVARLGGGVDGALSPFEAGVLGSFACLVACVIAYPGVAVKTLVMASGEDGEEGCRLLQAARHMWEGGRVYAGFAPFLARSVPPTGLLFAIQRLVEQNSMV